MTKLHERIALRKGEVGRNKSRLAKAFQNFKKPVIFGGMAKSYEPIEDNGEPLPNENKRVQRMVESDLDDVQDSLRSLWDIHSSVEQGNCGARADIMVDGSSILSDVPVTSLLFFENQLTDVRTMLEAIPTLSPDYVWRKDENDGLYKSDLVQTHRNVKHMRAIVKYDATEHHPAQTDLIEETKLAGHWNTVQHSGAMPSTRKSTLISRVDKLLDAVKAARSRANDSVAPDIDTSAVLEYLFKS